MQKLLSQIVSGLQAGLYPNEKAVSTSIVVPVFRKLGWDDTNPYEVRPEYQSGKGRVDYALFSSQNQPGVFVEVKHVGKAAAADVQLFEYAFHEGAQIAVLTDGRIWNFYVPGQPGSFEDRKVYQIDLLEQGLEAAEARFVRYLQKDRVANQFALQDALSDYKSKASNKKAEETIPKAWSELLAEPDMILKLLRDRTEALSGIVPREEALIAFIAKVNGGKTVQAYAAPNPQSITSISKAPILQATDTVGSSSPLGWQVLSVTGSAKSQNEALAGFLNELFNQFPDSIQAIISSVGTKTRAHIAKIPEEIYPKRPDLGQKAHLTLSSGHVLGTNVSAEEKIKIAQKAAAACSLNWGIDALLSI